MEIVLRERSKFQEDLVLGKRVEEHARDLALRRFPRLISLGSSVGKNKAYDFALGLKFEVKYDRMAVRTGNVAIEISCNGAPSGIMATEADYWLHGIPKMGMYMSDVKALRAYVQYKSPVAGGDGLRASMVLIPVSTFIELPFNERIGSADGKE